MLNKGAFALEIVRGDPELTADCRVTLNRGDRIGSLDSICLLWLYSLVCVRPGQSPHCWFSHALAQIQIVQIYQFPFPEILITFLKTRSPDNTGQ